ncbi:MAG: HypC/HybG/HupF family hydrogenase formation chaperone [Chloroflexi bacterium]|nr:HypC/HybG/HupF family hydrogenase formation chaperone [Chloroflexota bacterium]
MCLAVPMKIMAINGTMATMEVSGITKEASLMMLPEAKVGDYVLIHAGFAIQKVDEDEAQETLRLLAEIVSMEPGPPNQTVGLLSYSQD